MGLNIQEKRIVSSTATTAKAAPASPAEARASGAVDCAPKGFVDETLFDMQVGNERGVALNQVFKHPSNEVLEDQKAALTARRQQLVAEARPYEPSITLDTNSQKFSWNTAIAAAEMSDLAYSDEAKVREQAAKWGFDDVKFVDKRTPIRNLSDIFRARDVQAFVAGSKDAIAVTFRGTERGNLRDILTDLAALFPTHMRAKAFPAGLSAENQAAFNQKLVAAMAKRMGPDFIDVVANQNSRLTPEQLTKIVATLPEATAEAVGDPASVKIIENAIHRGFKEAKDMVAPELLTKVLSMWEDDLINQKPLRPVFLFGHSMGGSEATLFGYDLLSMTQQLGTLAKAAGLTNLAELVKPGFKLPLGGVYTFEAPHSFKKSAADEVRQLNLGFDTEDLIHNFVRVGDPVPNLPSWGSWTNMGNTIALDGTIGRLGNCPDPRAKVVFNPTEGELKAMKKTRKTDWLDATAPADHYAHLLGEVRDLVKEQAKLAAEKQSP